ADVQAEQVTVVADRGADVEALLAGLPGHGEVLAAVLDPLDRAAEGARCGGDRELLAGSTDLQSERASDVTGQHTHLPRFHAEAGGDPHPGDVHALRRRVHGQHARAGVVAGYAATALHGDVLVAVHVDVELGD